MNRRFLNSGMQTAHNTEPMACTANSTPTQSAAFWYWMLLVSSTTLLTPFTTVSTVGASNTLAATLPLVYVHMNMKANQQKNCTKPTVQNAFGAFTKSFSMLVFSFSSSAVMPWYSAYSAGGISFTFTEV